MATLNEQELRRPDFLGGRPVTLADGQEWTIPVPEIRLTRDRNTAEGFRLTFGFDGKPDEEFTRLQRQYDDNAGGARLAAEMALFDYALGLNYELTDEQASAILSFSVGSGVNDPSREAIHEAIAGANVPKPSSDGSILP
jgi:hypothetical protein